MNAVPIERLRPGVVLGRDITDVSGSILLHRGVCLTREYIEALKLRRYQYVYVKRDNEPAIDVEEDLNPVVRMRATQTLSKAMDSVGKNLQAFRKESHEDILKALSSAHVRSLMSDKGLGAQMSILVSEIIEAMLSKATLAGLTSMKSQDGQLYEHSIDVCTVAIMIGNVIGLPIARLRQLATGCLLHDIGMLFVDPAQDESVRVRQHTLLGYELLRNTDDPDILSPHVAYEHHEYQDGTGLPRGLVGGNRIARNRDQAPPVPTLIGEIAAVANCYDNLLSGGIGREPVPTDVALAEITERAGTHFNREIVAVFRRVVPLFPKGAEILLSGAPYDQFIGIVSEINPRNLERPFIILMQDASGNKIVPIEIDTLRFPKITLRTVTAQP